MKLLRLIHKIIDMPSGVAMGLITFSFCWALSHGKDVGLGAGTALATVYAGFAATKIKGKAEDKSE